jgi:hypothetical protein
MLAKTTEKEISEKYRFAKFAKCLCAISLFVISCDNHPQVKISAPQRDVFDEFTTIRKRIYVDDFGGAKSFFVVAMWASETVLNYEAPIFADDSSMTLETGVVMVPTFNTCDVAPTLYTRYAADSRGSFGSVFECFEESFGLSLRENIGVGHELKKPSLALDTWFVLDIVRVYGHGLSRNDAYNNLIFYIQFSSKSLPGSSVDYPRPPTFEDFHEVYEMAIF